MRSSSHTGRFLAAAWLALGLLVGAAPGQVLSQVPDEAPQAWARPLFAPEQSGEQAAELFHRIRVDGEPAGRAQVRVFTDNVEAWWIRWWLISRAERSIDITYFIIKDDVFGLSLLGLLAHKAREGVQVRFMLDSRGSRTLSSLFWKRGYLKELSKLPNVDVRIFNPLSRALLRMPKDLRNAVASNHDKILLVDDEWVLTGGRNIAVEYFAHPGDRPTSYRDTDVLLRGAWAAERARKAFGEEFFNLKSEEVKVDYPKWNPRQAKLELARQVMDRFLVDGTQYSEDQIGKALRPLARELHEQLDVLPRLAGFTRFEPFHDATERPVLVLDKSSFAYKYRNDITLNMVRLVDAAEHSVMIQNPYIILTKEMGEALKRATARGVEVVLHTNGPSSTDNLIAQAFFLRDWKRMIQDMPGLQVHVMPGPRPLHSKVMVVDDRVTVVGTYNMDPLSQDVNSEVVAVVECRDFARARRLEMAGDMLAGIEYKTAVGPDGTVEVIQGPEKQLTGFKGLISKLLAQWSWFRRVV